MNGCYRCLGGRSPEGRQVFIDPDCPVCWGSGYEVHPAIRKEVDIINDKLEFLYGRIEELKEKLDEL